MSLNSPDNFPVPESASTPFDSSIASGAAHDAGDGASRQAAGATTTETREETRPVPYRGNNGHGGNGQGRNGHGNNGHDSQGAAIDLSDPRTRAVVEQLMATLNQE